VPQAHQGTNQPIRYIRPYSRCARFLYISQVAPAILLFGPILLAGGLLDPETVGQLVAGVVVVSSPAAVLGSVLAGAAAIALLVTILDLAVTNLRWRIARWRMRHRVQRLEQVAGHHEGFRRLPHRDLESRYWSAPMLTARHRGTYASLPPGLVVVVHPRDSRRSCRPIAADSSFEPVEIERSNGGIATLWEHGLETAGLAERRAWCDKLYPNRHAAAGSQGLDLRRSFAVLGLLLLLFRGLGGPVPTGVLIPALALFWGPMVFVRIARHFVSRTWWLAPGALVLVTHRLWRLARRVRVLRRADAALVADFSLGHLFVAHGDEVFRLRCTYRAAWVAVAGWTARARTPTDAEVLAFLGPDTELASP
jgi:hypothetical protein